MFCSRAPATSSSPCRSHERELALEGAIAKLDKHHLLILDDIAYVSEDQAKTIVLFELIDCERRSMLITSNQSIGVERQSKATIKKMLANNATRADHDVAIGCHFKL